MAGTKLSSIKIRRNLGLLFLMVCHLNNYAQKTLTAPDKSPVWEISGSKKIYTGSRVEAPYSIEFITGKVKASDFILNMAKHFGIDSGSSLYKIKSKTDELGMTHHRFQQNFKGIAIEGLEYRVHERGGHMVSTNGKLIVRNLDVDVNPVLSEQQAFQSAKERLKVSNVEFKSGRLLITSKDFTFLPESFVLVYQFDIAVSIIEQWRVSIDAHTGELINKVNLVSSCNAESMLPYTTGTGTTAYNGTKEIKTEFVDTTYTLRGITDSGVLFETYDLKQDWFTADNDFMDSDNEFTDENAKAGVSAHWGMEQALNYFKRKYNRNGIFGNGDIIKSYVHYGSGVNNAYYSYPTTFYFGDGPNDSVPWVTLDIVGHEFTHGVVKSESGLYTIGEMGALNESFADIFGYAIELETTGQAANWTIGESVKEGGLRSFSNPNKTLQPDTYHGQFWNNNSFSTEAAHTNSGVQNFWFYLLCHGGTGVNDNGLAYQVDSIGVEKATAIVYRNIVEYQFYYSRFRDNRIGSLAAAADLYGNGSAVYNSVVNAWEAVGVSDSIKPIIWDVEATSISGASAMLNAKLPQNFPINSYLFEYGTTTAYGSTGYAYLYSYDGFDTYKAQLNLTGLTPNTHYYFRFVATNANGTSVDTGEFTTTSGEPQIQQISLRDLTLHSVTILSMIDTKGSPTTCLIEYGTTPSLGLASSSNAFPGYSTISFNYSYLYNLESYQNYYYRVIAYNEFGSDTTSISMFFSAVSPTISNLETTKAAVGSKILIYGTNFNTEASKNIVHFGAAQANVLTATENTLMVEVPVGASLGSVNYTNASSELSTVSWQEFVPVINLAFSEENLELKATVDGGLSPVSSFIYDLDANHKPDIINLCKGGFSILQNVHSSTSLADNSFVKTDYLVSDATTALDIADMNGDGLKDIIVNIKNGFRFYLNSSTRGRISFADPLDFDIAKPTGQIACADFDVDGKTDVAIEILGESISFYKNQNIKGVFLSSRFSKGWSHPIDSSALGFTTENFIGGADARPDLIFGLKNKGQYEVLANYSLPGTLYFSAFTLSNYSLGSVPTNFSIHDLNGDGLKDLASTPDDQAGNLTLHKGNYSLIDFYSPIEIGLLSSDTNRRMVSIADIDGEGTPDLVVGTAPGRFSILLNRTQPNNSLESGSFEQTKVYGTAGSKNGRGIAASDLNGDGKTDLVNITGNGNLIEIWENTSPDGPPCTAPTGLAIDTSNYYSVKISWDSVAPDAQYAIEYTSNSYTSWSSSAVTSNNETFSNLYPNTQYTARVKRVCGNFSSGFEYLSFSTTCAPPVYLYASYVDVADAYVYWYDQYYSDNYSLEYRVSGGQWLTGTRNGYYYYLSGLIPGTMYDIRIQSICSSGPSAFVYSSFTTLCPPPPTISIRSITTTSAIIELSSQNSGNYITEYSSNETDWIEVDSTMMLTNLSIGSAYHVRSMLPCGSAARALFSTLCPIPTDVSVKALTTSSAVIQWADEFDIGHYSVEYTEYGSIDYLMLPETTLLNQTIMDLAPETTYKARVFAICTDKISNRVPIFFTTPVITGLEPDGLTVSPIPVKKELSIQSGQNLTGKKLVIVDAIGRVVFQATLKEQNLLDLTHLLPGFFIVKIENERPVRIIKE